MSDMRTTLTTLDALIRDLDAAIAELDRLIAAFAATQEADR